VRCRRYWDFGALPYDGLRSDVIEPAIQECLESAVHHHMRSAARPVVMLSGGLDSRRILLSAVARGFRPATLTVPVPARATDELLSADEGIASRLAERATVPHERVDVDTSAALTAARRKRDVLLAGEADEHEWMTLLASAARGRFDLNFDGLAGDTLLANPFYHTPLEIAAGWQDVGKLSMQLASPFFDRFAARSVIRRRTRSLAERVEVELRMLPENPNRVSFLHLSGRTARIVGLAPEGLLASAVPSVYPYLSSGLLQLAVRLDPFWKKETGYHRRGIDRAFPGFADVPSTHDSVDGLVRDGWTIPLHRAWRSGRAPSRVRAGELVRGLRRRPKSVMMLSRRGRVILCLLLASGIAPDSRLASRLVWYGRPLRYIIGGADGGAWRS
jgi:asparagine synthetase B (glutamine-hydrolysing)